MSELRPDAHRAGGFALAGELSFDSVPGLLEAGRVLFEGGGGRIRLDLAAVTRSDSAGLALLIEWLRSARQGGREITFLNIPPQMLATARLSGLDRILPLEEAADPSA